VSGSEEESSGADSAAGRLLAVLGASRRGQRSVDFEGFVEALVRHAAELKGSPEALDVLVAALPAFTDLSGSKRGAALAFRDFFFSYLMLPDASLKWEAFLVELWLASISLSLGKSAGDVWSSAEAGLKTALGELKLKREKLSPG